VHVDPGVGQTPHVTGVGIGGVDRLTDGERDLAARAGVEI
jgi:hypothetical protein